MRYGTWGIISMDIFRGARLLLGQSKIGFQTVPCYVENAAPRREKTSSSMFLTLLVSPYYMIIDTYVFFNRFTSLQVSGIKFSAWGYRPIHELCVLTPVALWFVSVTINISADYGRVVLAIISFYFMPTRPWLASSTYLLSGLLDAFDGWAARKFNQRTMFGAVLDMVIDRWATDVSVGRGHAKLELSIILRYVQWHHYNTEKLHLQGSFQRGGI